MGFFDDVRMPGGDAEDEDDYSAPAWLEAPEDFVAGVVALELVLGRSDEAAVYVTRIAAYPTGFEFDAEVVTRKAARIRYPSPFELMHDPERPAGEIPPEVVRLGVEFADGRRATSFGEALGGSTMTTLVAAEGDESPDPARDIFMTPGRGGGSARHSTTSYWVWPLPPPGPLTFACEWPAFGIEETTVEIDTERLLEASRRARSVWPG
jgi:hypothetical protein